MDQDTPEQTPDSKAVSWYQRSIDQGGEKIWALENMARAYLSMGDQSKYEGALERLRVVNPNAAQGLEQAVTGTAEKR